MINQRKIALQALNKVNVDNGYSNLVLQNTLSDYGVGAEDKPFITALFYGVLDRKLTLDYVISKFIKKPVSKIKPITLNSLRLAVFQIMFMDKIPESAAVNESVKLVKNSKENYNTAFVNAVLREILRTGINLPGDDSLKSLSVRYSCPEWLIESFLSDYGASTANDILNHFLTVPDITVRINNSIISDDQFFDVIKKENVSAHKINVVHAAAFKNGVDIKSLFAYKNGLFYVQDIPSQVAVSELLIKNGERVFDMCASPGGKTFLSALSGKDTVVTACDFYEKRVELIRQSAKRLGLENIKCMVADSRIYNSSIGLYDAVICDVPCSGLGVIRRKPEIKYKTNLDFNELTINQTKILENGLKYLKKGGRLLYSTCTLRKAENEDIVRACLDKHSDFELKYEHTFLPSVDNTDGFYFAIIKSR